MTTNNKIIKWLKGRNLWAQFCNNAARHYNYRAREFHGQNIGRYFVAKYGYGCISFAFTWEDSPEGWGVWSIADRQLKDKYNSLNK